MKRITLLITALTMLLGAPVFAWGPLGHRTIATLALEQLEKSNPAAAAKVKEILAGESIEDASIWPDDIRHSKMKSHSGRFSETPEGKAFTEAHPDNSSWHYLDLPLDIKTYAQDKRFITDNDIVATIGKCIDVLEGKSEFMSKRDALRWLVHLGGDVHQPLHVAAGFFKFDDDGRATLITSPDEAAKNPDSKDSGGNKLLLTKDLPLHRYWDENVLSMTADTEAKLAVVIRKKMAELKPANNGPCREWPPLWAMDSAETSRKIYAELRFGKRFPRSGNYWTLYLNLKPDTREKFRVWGEERVAKAALDLGDLLAAIQWTK